MLVFTIVAEFWARVELQSMRYTPWIALHSRGLSLDEDIATLDYTSMLLPTALVQSLRRKHYVLSLVIVTSIVLIAQVALAPGLFSLAAVRVEYDTDIQTLDSFDAETRYPDNSTVKTETSAFYMVSAIRDFDMAHTFGVTDVVAYQTFGSRRGGVDGSRGTVREPLRALVDGLFAEVQCLKLKSHSVLASIEVFHPCLFITPTRGRIKGQWLTKNGLPPEMACSGLPQKNTQFVYYAALFAPSATNASRPGIHKAAALVCTSDAWLEKVEVTDDGISPNVPLLPNQERRPIAANPWELVRMANPNIFQVDGQMGSGLIAGPVGADWLKDAASDPADPAMYENDILLNSTTNVLKTMIPYLGHYIIRREGATGAMSTTIATVDRLLVNHWICISMAVLFTFVSVAAFIIIEHSELFEQLSGLETKKPLVNWDQCSYSPPALRGYFRALSTILIIGVIAGLIIAHEISASFDGIASIDDEGYTHLLWTSVPSLTMLSRRDQQSQSLENLLRARRSLSGLLMRQGETSLNYLRNTYYDLVFPSLGGMQDIELSQTLSVNMTMPAAQLSSTCRKLSEGDDYPVVFGGRKEFASPFIRDVYVGQALKSVNDLADVNVPCGLGLNVSELRLATEKHETYLWGECVNGTNFSESISVYSCAYEWTEVATKVHFVPVDGDLIIDPTNPPQPDDSTRRPWNHLFASKFAVLVQPYGKFTMEDLGDSSKEEKILDALRRNVGFISAQIVNIENRLAVNTSSLKGPPLAEGFPPVKATIFSEGDYRLVQNTTATYVLVGILSAVVLFNFWALLSAALRRSALSQSRLLAMDVRGLAPKGFNSFAVLGSLLRDSNVASHLMPGADLLSTEELHGLHSHLGFRLGWFQDESSRSRHFIIGVLGDEGFKFLCRKKIS
ncbi:hypothetical protein CMUS01_09124 [Colletotrichum musicola]|uniref:Uncharacterized protein n=1 Tax=Colletotrichum musicola TaxID=2175873 RepID=A0A8H6K8R8_9PEZI|nr:hypothetical protein CMUS01_09124 [Colletotrichum musicola]